VDREDREKQHKKSLHYEFRLIAYSDEPSDAQRALPAANDR
jgi:hypothetical protein